MQNMDLKNKKVTVVGLGNSGINAAILLRGVGAHVWATDSNSAPGVLEAVGAFKDKDIKVETGKHTKAFVAGSSLVVISPGVEDTSPAVRWAIESGIPIISEMELGYMFCKGRIIAITGTNGKSTVTTLIGKMLKDGGFDAAVCGNIGNALCGEIPRIEDDTWVVLEVSSFQLERIKSFKPHIAIILNITDDHLDRYKKFDDYVSEKLKIFANQSKDDTLILNYDAVNLRRLKDMADSRVLFYSRSGKTNGAYVKDGEIVLVLNGKEKVVGPVRDIPLKGMHNLENVLASCLASGIAGVREDSMINSIRGFKGLSHRVETVGVVNGVEYVDDSKGTTVDSTYRALEASEKPVILIAGGRDKNSDYTPIRAIVKEKVKHLILIGEAKTRIAGALGDVVRTHEAKTMDDAVQLAGRLAGGDTMVLLSPMCSSFDMFVDYKHRGEAFKEAVKRLKGGRAG